MSLRANENKKWRERIEKCAERTVYMAVKTQLLLLLETQELGSDKKKRQASISRTWIGRASVDTPRERLV